MNALLKFFSGTSTNRPAITPAQVLGLIPIIAALLAAYGIFTPDQIQPLKDALYAGIALFGADTVLRVGRNIGDGLSTKTITATTVHTDTVPDGHS